jgi:hypothetical protein
MQKSLKFYNLLLLLMLFSESLLLLILRKFRSPTNLKYLSLKNSFSVSVRFFLFKS